VLVADDNADMRNYLSRLLSAHYEVETVADGAAALAAARARPPDLALADVMMPEMDGFGLLRELRADPHTRAIPVLLLSARAGQEATIEGLQTGADDYLVKPFSANELLTRVAMRLEMARLRAEAEVARGRLYDLFMQAPACICVLGGPEHRVELINDNFRALYGWREFMGKTAREAWPELANQGFFELLDQVYKTGEPVVIHEAPARIDRNNNDALDDGYFTFVYQPARDIWGAVEGILVFAIEVTDQVRARQFVRAEEAMARGRAAELETILDTIPDGVVIYDETGRLLRWNTALAELFEFGQMPEYAGLAVDERPGRLDVRDEHGQPMAASELPFMRAARGEVLTGTQAVDLTVTTPSGRVKNVSASAAPLRDASGRTIGAITVYRDVTERRQSEERLRAILELLPVGAAFVDADGKAVLVNQAVRKIWGENIFMSESRSDYGAYRAWWSATGKPVAADEWGLARALTTGEVTIGEEFDIETRDGVRKSILGSNAPLRDASGAIVGGMSVIMDISERKRLERRTHDILEALLAMAEALVLDTETPGDGAERDAAWVADQDTSAPFVPHSGVRRLMTLTQQVFRGQYTAVTITEPTQKELRPVAVVGLSPEIEQRWWRSVRQGRLTDYFTPDHIERLYAGETLILDMSARPPIAGQDYFGIQAILVAPALMRSGHLCLLGAEVRGRTAFTPEELDLAQAAVRLVALVLEREQLQREREEARTRELALGEANRRMDEFLGIASHELRTPLTSAQANVQLIERRIARIASVTTQAPNHTVTADALSAQLAPLAPLVERTERQMRRLNRLVSDLLDVTRIRGGQLEFQMERFDLVALTREAVDEQRPAWPGRAITFETSRDHLLLRADADRIGQVVTNYLTNALKYSPRDQAVATQLSVRDGAVRVEVRDSGPGLTPEQQAHLFERFYRVPGIEQRSGSGVGLGLGLSICRTIIERHGGKVGVESAVGTGSTFWFTLPLTLADD
jgi:signal transduction histidine kinase/DNA-binding response OmpR family regulator